MDWAGLMRLGLGRLGLAPEAFWRLTPLELLLRLGIDGGCAPMTRGALEALVRAWPDREPGEGDGA
jgi:uncharacterized phage protein (TIGR02216 family)